MMLRFVSAYRKIVTEILPIRNPEYPAGLLTFTNVFRVDRLLLFGFCRKATLVSCTWTSARAG